MRDIYSAIINARAVDCPASGRIFNTAYAYWARKNQRTQSTREKISLWSKTALCVLNLPSATL
jgi:hypothetical protein